MAANSVGPYIHAFLCTFPMLSAMTLSVVNRETCSVVLTVSGAVMTIHEIAHNCTQSQGKM